MSLSNVESLRYFVPELVLSAGILVLLLADMAFRGRRSAWNAGIAVAVMLGALAAAVAQTGAAPTGLFMGMVALDPFGTFYKIFLLATGAVIVLVAHPYRELTREFTGESYALLLGVVLGTLLLATATNLLMIYLALEMVSLPSYLLTGILRRDEKSSEAGLKYVLFGAAASGCMVYGMSLFYGMTGTLDLAELRGALGDANVSSAAMLVATAFVFAGFGFKISMVPFHMWAPDVYEGASTPVTAFLSVAPKAAGLAALLRFCLAGLATSDGDAFHAFYGLDWPFLVGVLSAVTMTLGNLAAIRQENVKRMLAYSSIAHAGYLLMGAVLLTAEGLKAIAFYLVVYGIMNVGAFLVVIAMSREGRRETFADYRGLGWRMPLVAIPMAMFLFSLTGIPPFSGFIGKVYLFKAVVARDLWWLAVIGVLNSVVSLVYYARLVKTMFLDDPAEAAPALPRVPWLYVALLAALAVPTFVFGFQFGWIDRISTYSMRLFTGS